MGPIIRKPTHKDRSNKNIARQPGEATPTTKAVQNIQTASDPRPVITTTGSNVAERTVYFLVGTLITLQLYEVFVFLQMVPEARQHFIHLFTNPDPALLREYWR